MKKNHVDFWILLLLAYGVICVSVIRADETGMDRARALLNQGQADQAIALLQSETQSNPAAADARVLLGMAYLQKNDFAQARASFEAAVRIKPDIVPAHFHLAMLYEKDGDNARALAEWKQVEALAADQNLKSLAGKHIKQLEGKR